MQTSSMDGEKSRKSRTHDLLGSLLGAIALILLICSPWQIDTTGPDPFYKGPLIFPILTLLMMSLASLPFWYRLLRPAPKSLWWLDGRGIPWKTLQILILLPLYLAGLLTVGLEIATILFLVISLLLVGVRSPQILFVIPPLVTLILYIVFKYLLDIWFPEPLLFQYFSET